MPASDRTVREIARVILRHVNPEEAGAIVSDLLRIKGNLSFRTTITKLADELLSAEEQDNEDRQA